MKMHPKLTRIGNICLIVTSVNTAEGTATIKVTDRSESTNPGILDRLFDVSSSVTVMTVRFPVEGCFDLVQHHRLKGVAELEVGDELNAYIFHDAEFRELALVSVAEERFLRNELQRFGNANQKKQPPKQKHQHQHRQPEKVAAKATTDSSNEENPLSSGYNLEAAFSQDGGPRRADVAALETVPDRRTGRGHRQPAPRRQQQQQSQAA